MTVGGGRGGRDVVGEGGRGHMQSTMYMYHLVMFGVQCSLCLQVS